VPGKTGLRAHPSNLIRFVPAKGGRTPLSTETPQWGIEPVPERLRVLGLGDTVLLWGNLAVSLLVIVAGSFLVPALSLKEALLVIVIASVVGSLMLGAAAAVGTDARVPSMVLMRAPLGHRGSYLATALNVVQCLGWSVYELIIIASACAALSDRVFGFRAQWLWTLLFGGVAIALALLGPIGFVRRYVRKFAVWFVLASLGYLTWWAVDKSDLTAFWHADGKGGFPTFWQGIDLTLASVISWTPLAADYTRFTRTRRSSFWGTAVGYMIPAAWLYALGVLLFLARDISDPAQLPAAVVAGGVVSVIALLAVTVDESDEAFANVYSTAVSLQNVVPPRVSQRVLIVASAVVATAGALVLGLNDFSTFLFLLGSFFVPLLGVLLADWLVDGMHYTREKIFDGPAFRPEMIAAWLVGFGLYQWLSPQGPAWWQHLVGHTDPTPIDFTASLPSFAAAFCLAGLAALVMRNRRQAEAFAET
jgi:nucleobase:cation symporter-1, NCS1 family